MSVYDTVKKLTDILERYYGLMIMSVFAGGILLGATHWQSWLAWVAVAIIAGNVFFLLRRRMKKKRGYFIFGRK